MLCYGKENEMKEKKKETNSSYIRQLESLSYRCFCCFLISCAARPPHRVGLPYMLERAGLDVQQGIVNLLSTTPFCGLNIFLPKGAPCMSALTYHLHLHPRACSAVLLLLFPVISLGNS